MLLLKHTRGEHIANTCQQRHAMQAIKTKDVRKSYFTVLALLLFSMLSAQAPPFTSMPDTVFTRVDQMPYFIGCEAFDDATIEKRECSDLELVRFISRYLVYPEKARYGGIEGTVFVSFIIGNNGLVSNLELLKDIGGGCGQAALDVIEEMPLWQPGSHQGKPVRVRMNLPIQFSLKAKWKDDAEPYQLSWGNLRGKKTTKKALLSSLTHQLYVRGPEGSNRYVDEIEFIYEKDDKLFSAASRGNISSELEKIVDKVKHDGTFTIFASVQDNGHFVSVSRSFQVVK